MERSPGNLAVEQPGPLEVVCDLFNLVCGVGVDQCWLQLPATCSSPSAALGINQLLHDTAQALAAVDAEGEVGALEGRHPPVTNPMR